MGQGREQMLYTRGCVCIYIYIYIYVSPLSLQSCKCMQYPTTWTHAQHVRFKHHTTVYEEAETTTGGVRIKLRAMKKETEGKKRWKVEGGYIWAGSQKCFGCRYALPTHQLHVAVRSGMHQSSLAVVCTYRTPMAPRSWGIGSPKHSKMSPCKQEKELNITYKAEVVATCIAPLARGLWCVLGERWQ